MLNVDDDQASLTMFANAVEQAIQDFLVSTLSERSVPVQLTDKYTRADHYSHEWKGQ